MNIQLFGKIIAGLGILIMLVGIVPPLTSLEERVPRSEFAEFLQRNSFFKQKVNPTDRDYEQYVNNINYLRQKKIMCVFSRIGNKSCPMNGYTAIFTYLGFIILVVGGGMVLASRKTTS